jgi:hypothetical protein
MGVFLWTLLFLEFTTLQGGGAIQVHLISARLNVHVRYMSSEVEPCVVWALRVLLSFLAKLIED